MAQVALRKIVKTFDKTPAVQGIDASGLRHEDCRRELVSGAEG